MSNKPVFDLWDPTSAPENWARFSVKAKDGVIAGISAEDGVGVMVIERAGDELRVMFRQYLLSHHETMTIAQAVDGQTIMMNMTKNMVTSVFVDGNPVFVGRLNRPSYRGHKFQFFADQKVTDLELYNGEGSGRRTLTQLIESAESLGQDYWMARKTFDAALSEILYLKFEGMAFSPDGPEFDAFVSKIESVIAWMKSIENTDAQ